VGTGWFVPLCGAPGPSCGAPGPSCGAPGPSCGEIGVPFVVCSLVEFTCWDQTNGTC
jgi:hypothetical protein